MAGEKIDGYHLKSAVPGAYHKRLDKNHLNLVFALAPLVLSQIRRSEDSNGVLDQLRIFAWNGREQTTVNFKLPIAS